MSKSRLGISLALVLVALVAEAMVIVERGSYRLYDIVIMVCIAGIGVVRIRKYLRTRVPQK